jgi:hypothetical protein
VGKVSVTRLGESPRGGGGMYPATAVLIQLSTLRLSWAGPFRENILNESYLKKILKRLERSNLRCSINNAPIYKKRR